MRRTIRPSGSTQRAIRPNFTVFWGARMTTTSGVICYSSIYSFYSVSLFVGHEGCRSQQYVLSLPSKCLTPCQSFSFNYVRCPGISFSYNPRCSVRILSAVFFLSLFLSMTKVNDIDRFPTDVRLLTSQVLRVVGTSAFGNQLAIFSKPEHSLVVILESVGVSFIRACFFVICCFFFVFVLFPSHVRTADTDHAWVEFYYFWFLA